MKGKNSEKTKLSAATDNALNKFEEVILFPEKLAKANQMLHKIGLSKVKKQLKHG